MGVWNTDTIRPQSLEGLLKKTSVLTLLKAVEDEAVENVRKQKHLSWGEKSFYTLLFWDRILLWIPHWPWTWVNPASVFQGLGFSSASSVTDGSNFFPFFPLPPTLLWTYHASQAGLKLTVIAQVDLQLLIFLLPSPKLWNSRRCVSHTRLVCCWVSNPRLLYWYSTCLAYARP